jgi:hypothetical protein
VTSKDHLGSVFLFLLFVGVAKPRAAADGIGRWLSRVNGCGLERCDIPPLSGEVRHEQMAYLTKVCMNSESGVIATTDVSTTF